MASTKLSEANLWRGGAAAVFLLVIALAVGVAPAFSQCTLSSPSSWNVTSGNWSTASNWSPSGVPNSPATNVCLTNGASGAPATTTLDIGVSVANLMVGGSNTLNINNNLALVVSGTAISNAGGITLNGGGNANGNINIGNNVTLSGGGAVTLSTAGGGGNAIIQQNAGGLTLTNADNTIQGNGIIGGNGLALVNQAGGVIDATSASGLIGTLTLNGGGAITNQGLMEATTGTLVIQNNVTSTGNITANVGTVQVMNSTITGGTLNTTGGGVMETVNAATLNGVTISSGSTYTASDNATTTLLGTINNNGAIQLNGGGNASGYIYIGSNMALSGGGTVTLSTAGGGGNAIIQQNAGGLTLTNADNTIQGNGIIGGNGLALVNGGTLLANVSGQTLLFNGGGSITNNGTFEATAGSLLHTQSGPFTNFSGTTLTGGTYDANGTIQIDQLGSTGGEIVTNNASIILDGSSSGAATIIDSAGNSALSALATNQGSFTVENGGNANFTTVGDLANAGTVTAGVGTTLSLGSGGANALNQSAGTTEGVGTIAGAVNINGGQILPGAPNTPGTLNITGIYSQTGGVFNEQISNAANGLLNVSGAASFSGTTGLNINQLGGFNPTVGTTYTLINAGSVSGTFSNTTALEDTAFNGGTEDWQVIYNPSSVVIQADSALVTATWAPPPPSGTNGHWTPASEWTCTATPTACMPNNTGIFTFNAVLNSSGNTLTLDSTDSPSSITVQTLSLQAGTLDIGSGGTLNLANQPNGITDIPQGAGLSVEGAFTAGLNNGLTNLGSVEGTLTLDNGQSTGATPSSGTLTVSSTGAVNVSGASTALAVTGGVANSGAVAAVGLGGISTSGDYAQTSGTTTVNGGSLGVGGALTNDSASQLFIQNLGSVTANSADNLGAIITGSAVSDSGSNTLSTFGAFTNESSGSLSLMANADTVTANGDFTNNGAISVSSGTALIVNGPTGYTQNSGSTSISGTLSAANSYIQNGGTTSIASGGSLSAGAYAQSAGTTDVNGTLISSALSIGGGTLEGSGLIEGTNTGGSATVTVTNATLQAGDSPGTFHIIGDLNLSTATVNELIGGGTAGTDFSVLAVTGNVDLITSDTLIPLDLLSFTPTNGETFDIIDAASITGQFTDNSIVFQGGTFTVSYNTSGCNSGSACVELTWNASVSAATPEPATPEPASLLLLGTGLLGLGWAVRRRKMPRAK